MNISSLFNDKLIMFTISHQDGNWNGMAAAAASVSHF